MPAQVSRAAEWSWVLLAFTVANLTYAATQPAHPREGLGDEGQIYHAMAKAMPRELPPPGAAPYVYRIGMPLAAATVAKSLDWVIAAGFDRLNLAFNALSVILLTILLRRHVPSVFARVVVVVAFIVEPHSPIRLTYLHPLSTDSVLMAGLLAGLVAIEWFASRPTPRRAGLLAMLVVIGVVFHELMLIIGVCVLFAPLSGDTPRVGGANRLAVLERTGAWLPLISAALALVAIHAWVVPTPSNYSWLTELMRGFSEKSILQVALALVLVFGPLLVLPAYFWQGAARFLGQHAMFGTYLVLCVAWAWSSRDLAERGLALASPVAYLLIARALATAAVEPAGAGMAGLLFVQGLSSRVFSPIGGPIETPTVLNEVWERLGSADLSWALSYPNMWSQLCATTMIPIYLAWYAVVGSGVWMLVRQSAHAAGDGEPAPSPEPSVPAAIRPLPIVGLLAGPRRIVALCLLTAVALAPVVWLALSRFYWSHYAAPGGEYLAYNLARTWLIVVLLAAFWATGSRIARGAGAARSPDRWIEHAIAGAAAWSIAVVLLAAMHLYYLWSILPMLVAATALAIGDLLDRQVAAPSKAEPPNQWGFTGIILRFGVAIHALVILVGIALWGHFGGDNDVPGNYLPYYDTVLRDHTIAPGAYWVHFFASKGNGLAFLANLLSDVQGSGLATYAMLLLGAGMIWRLAARPASAVPAIGLIGACLFLQYYAGQGAYAKSHIIRNLFLLYIVLSGVRMLFLRQGIDEVTRVARVLVIVAVIILSPLALVLLLPMLMIELAFLAWSRRADLRRSLTEAAWALGTTAVVCGYNFVQTGLPELHNMPSFMSRFVSIDRLSRWMDPGLSYLDYRLAFLQVNLPGQHAAATSAMTFAPTQSLAQVAAALMSAPTLVLLGVGLSIGVIGFALPQRRGGTADSPRGTWLAVAYILVVLAMLATLQMFGGGAGSSMGRFTDFANPLGIALAVIVLTAAWSIDMPRLLRRLVAASIAVTAVVAIYLGSGPVLALSWRDNVGFVLGQHSYASLNQYQWDTHTAARMARSVPAGRRAEMLSFLPGFTAVPGTPFQRPDGCVYLQDYTAVLYGSPDQIAGIYDRYDIDHFLFDVSRDAPIVWSGFSELFAPDVLRSRMRLVMHEQTATRDLYLLTWRTGGDHGGDGFDDFLERWTEKLAIEKENGLFYGGFEYGAQRLAQRE